MLSKAERVAGAVALVLALLHQAFFADSGTDLAAQLARASFAHDAPLTPVDLSWYGGVHPFAYSLLSPWVMAVLGVGVSGVLAAVAAAVLFARLLRDLERPVLSGSIGAFFAVADVASGRTTFALGAVTVLAALLCRERRGWAILFAVLTALLSPVAAAFLGFCAGVLVLHRRPGGWTLGLATAVPVITLGVLFPSGGVQPFDLPAAAPALAVALALAVLTTQPLVRTGALLYAVAVLVFLGHADPFGSNVLRLGILTAASLALATSHRSTLLCALVAVGSLTWQLDPLHGDLGARPGPELAALTAELVSLDAKRVEVVAPVQHRESWVVAERVPLARGWARQIDYRDNRLFYEGTLTGDAYLRWLRAHAVDHVGVPTHTTVDFGSTRELALLHQPLAGLTQVWQDRDWRIFAVDQATPIAAAPAVVTTSTRTRLAVRSDTAADVTVRIRWSRWLDVAGPACLIHQGDQVVLRFLGPGTAVVGSSLLPHGHC